MEEYETHSTPKISGLKNVLHKILWARWSSGGGHTQTADSLWSIETTWLRERVESVSDLIRQSFVDCINTIMQECLSLFNNKFDDVN